MPSPAAAAAAATAVLLLLPAVPPVAASTSGCLPQRLPAVTLSGQCSTLDGCSKGKQVYLREACEERWCVGLYTLMGRAAVQQQWAVTGM